MESEARPFTGYLEIDKDANGRPVISHEWMKRRRNRNGQAFSFLRYDLDKDRWCRAISGNEVNLYALKSHYHMIDKVI